MNKTKIVELVVFGLYYHKKIIWFWFYQNLFKIDNSAKHFLMAKHLVNVKLFFSKMVHKASLAHGFSAKTENSIGPPIVEKYAKNYQNLVVWFGLAFDSFSLISRHWEVQFNFCFFCVETMRQRHFFRVST